MERDAEDMTGHRQHHGLAAPSEAARRSAGDGVAGAGHVRPAAALGEAGSGRAACALCHTITLTSGAWCPSCRVALGAVCAGCHAFNPRSARFCLVCGMKLAAQAADDGSLRPERQAVERRHVTVMFADLVGSTSLATSMDAEDYTDVIRAALRCMAEVTARFGGFVAHYLGDGTLSYFGYPTADENDTERAVRAALEMVDAVAVLALPGERRLSLRVGISAGEVVIGDIMGLRDARGLDMAGELPTLAARLQAAAEPGTVLVDANVARKVGSLFDCDDLGGRELKGWRSAVPVWRVVRPSHARFERAGHPGLTPLIGRASEAASLAACWERAQDGRGGAVLLIGEPGLGKSRLVADLLHGAARIDHARFCFSCSALDQGVPLAPYIRQIEHGAGFAASDGPEARRAKLGAALAEAPESEREAIAGLLGLTAKAQPAGAQLAPRRRLERTIAALANLIARSAEKRPVLAVFEDAHWSDPTSLEMLSLAVRHVAARRVLLVITGRPEFAPSWMEHPNVSLVRLDPLSAAESQALVLHVAGEAELSPGIARDIVARSDGVPLFLEEVTKAAIEAGEQLGRAPGSTVPLTIHSSLLARLDRLGAAREIAEVAAAVGRDFSLDMLARVTGRSEGELQPALDRLVESGLVLGSAQDERHFRFKHALIQDAAYRMVLRDERRALHGRIAEALESHFPATAAAEPQLLAHHCTAAGRVEKAGEWWLRAGIQSLMRSATTEAIAQLKRGLDAVSAMPASPQRDRRELDLRIAYAKSLIATEGHASPRTGETFATARHLCDRLGQPPQVLTVLHGQWSNAFFRGELSAARRQASEILQAAESNGEESWLLVGHYTLGATCLPLGAFERVCSHLRRGLATRAAQEGNAYAGPIMPDPAVVMRTYLSWALMCQGELGEARLECQAALDDAQRLGQGITTAYALWHEAFFVLNTVSAEAALPLLDDLQSLANEHGMALYEVTASIFRGYAHGLLGDHANGLSLMRSARERYTSTQQRLYVSSFLRYEAELLGRAGAAREGLQCLAEGRRLRDEAGARWDEAEFERARAELLWAAGEDAAAEQACRHAIRLAQARSARLFELRASAALATRLASRGRSREAAELLTPICREFEGRGSSCDVANARRLLDTMEIVSMMD